MALKRIEMPSASSTQLAVGMMSTTQGAYTPTRSGSLRS